RIMEGEKADVLDAGLQVGGAGGRDGERFGVEQVVEDGDVVAGEVGNGAHIGANGSEVGAHGVEVMELAEVARIEVGLQVTHGGVVEEDVADHENAFAGGGEGGEGLAVGDRGGERLFAEDILAGSE